MDCLEINEKNSDDENENYGEKIFKNLHNISKESHENLIISIKNLDEDIDNLKILDSNFTENPILLNIILEVCILSHIHRINFQKCQFSKKFNLNFVPKLSEDKLRCLYSL